MSVLHERLIWRSKVAPRLDDGNMQKRFETFVKTTVPVIDYYKTQGKVVRIEASPRVEEVYKEIQLATCDILVEVLVRL
jgi:UMP-CMP kinase